MSWSLIFSGNYYCRSCSITVVGPQSFVDWLIYPSHTVGVSILFLYHFSLIGLFHILVMNPRALQYDGEFHTCNLLLSIIYFHKYNLLVKIRATTQFCNAILVSKYYLRLFVVPPIFPGSRVSTHMQNK